MSGENFVTMGPVPDFQNDGLSQTGFGFSTALQSPPSTIVPAVSNKRIFVHALQMTQSQSGTGFFVDMTTAGATVAILNGSPTAGFDINSGIPYILPYSQYPWFTCAAGDAFAFAWTAGNTVFVGGRITYVQG